MENGGGRVLRSFHDVPFVKDQSLNRCEPPELLPLALDHPQTPRVHFFYVDVIFCL